MKGIQRSELWGLQSSRFFKHRCRNVQQRERVKDLPGSHHPIRSSPTYGLKQLCTNEITSNWPPGFLSEP